MSATSAPARSRSGRPSTSGRTTSTSAASNTSPLCSAISVWNRGYSLYGRPPPLWKQPMIFCSTSASSGMNCATRARLSGPGGAGQHRRAMRWKRIRLCSRVVFDDLCSDHPAQPLPHIPFVEPGGVGDLRTGRRLKFGKRVEQPGLVSDGQQDGQAGVVDTPTIRLANSSVVSASIVVIVISW